MDKGTRKPRKIESAAERAGRLENAKQQRRDDAAADDDRIAELVRRNIEQRGP